MQQRLVACHKYAANVFFLHFLYYHVTDVALSQSYCHIIIQFFAYFVFVLFVYLHGE